MFLHVRLRDLREDFDKNQEDIAAILTISGQQYQLYESGKRKMPLHLFAILARDYTVTLDDLAGLIDTPRKLEYYLPWSTAGSNTAPSQGGL
ncbi:MAG: helix-turn-helix transcriptional regulator [Clostridia bacterium]|nr:helix-turn-helix transcriptional regulator [Clostridia bacterium]